MSAHHHHALDDVHYDVATHDYYPYPHHHEYHPDDVFVTVDHLTAVRGLHTGDTGGHPDNDDYTTRILRAFTNHITTQPADHQLIGESGYDITHRTPR